MFSQITILFGSVRIFRLEHVSKIEDKSNATNKKTLIVCLIFLLRVPIRTTMQTMLVIAVLVTCS